MSTEPTGTLRQQARRRQLAGLGLLASAVTTTAIAIRTAPWLAVVTFLVTCALLGLLLFRQARANHRSEASGAEVADFAGISLRDSSGPVMAFVDGRSRLSRVTGRLAVTAGVLQWSPDRTSRRLGQAQSLRVPVADVTSAEAERVLGKPYARLRLQDGSQLLMDLRKASRLVEVLNGGADSDEGR